MCPISFDQRFYTIENSVMPNEQPIDMTFAEVRNIVGGLKTMFRRLMEPQPAYHWMRPVVDRETGVVSAYCDPEPTGAVCPFGPIGSRLWVREIWRPMFEQCGTGYFGRSMCDIAEFQAHEGEKLHTKIVRPMGESRGSWSRHTWSPQDGGSGPWMPSDAMPREASRLELQITNVIVEPLSEISLEDAIAEGCPGSYTPAFCVGGEITDPDGQMPYDDFRDVWCQQFGAESWAADLWVWGITFRVLDKRWN